MSSKRKPAKNKKETVPSKKAIKKTAKKAVSKKNEENLTPDQQSVRNLVRANTIGLACLAGAIVANIGLVWHTSVANKEVIAITETGSIINPVPLPQAFVNDSRVLSFVDTCLRESFSHDFENYRRTVNAAMDCYTQSGGLEFKTELEKTLQEVMQKRLVMSVTLEPPSIMNGPYLANGRATWEVQTIMTMFYQGAKERYQPQRFYANVKVVRVPLEESTSGISINSLQLTRSNLGGGF